MKRTFVLSQAPFRYPGVRRDPSWGVSVYQGDRLPEGLQEFSAKPHSWEMHVQHQLNRTKAAARTTPPQELVLRDHQADPVKTMVKTAKRGAPGFLLAFPTGSGKTLMAIDTAGKINAKRVLVVTKLSVMPAWRALITQFGHPRTEWIVVNPEQLWKLFYHPSLDLGAFSVEKAAEIAAIDGGLRSSFDMVVVDEAHILANWASLRSRLVRRLIDTCEEGPFRLYMSATPFTSPEEASYVADLLAFVTGSPVPEDLADFPQWIRRIGFRLNTDSKGVWFHRLNRQDVGLIETLLYSSGVGAQATAQQLGLPAQQRTMLPVELTPAEQGEYELSWDEFRKSHGYLTEDGRPRDSGYDAALRAVQKASLLKSPHVAEIVADLVQEGNQVAVPQWFVESIHSTAMCIAAALKKRGLNDRVVEITGQDRDLREKKRQAFQSGRALVVVFNALEGIGLHAGEDNVDGKGMRGTDTSRVCVIADVLTGGKRALQAEGRTQRDGRASRAIYVYAQETSEEEWILQMFRQLSNTAALTLSGHDTDAFSTLADTVEAMSPLKEASR